VIFRRARFEDVIARQLDLFERDHVDLLAEMREQLVRYDEAERDEAEERYGDYADSVETGAEILAELRDSFARTLEEAAAEEYEREFNRAVERRLPAFAAELESL
jgi:rubrerythrin